jgi:sialic acid synthase SpsE
MKPVLIIAEAGVNHNGDLDIAKALIDAAGRCKGRYCKISNL